VEVEFIAKKRDACGFIMDFGKMDCIKQLLARLDHTLVIAMDDPFYPFLRQAAAAYLKAHPKAAMPYNAVVVTDPSAEGMALHLAKELNLLVQHHTDNRVRVKSVRFYEELSASAEAVL
jgi:6-pyruvoyl-tetrahydropterin synthase